MKQVKKLVRVEDTPVGKGVFAKRAFRRDKLIAEIQGTVYDDPDYHSDYCMELSDTESLEPDPPFCYLNHSCDPNCSLVEVEIVYKGEKKTESGLYLESLRKIEPDEQLTIDYGWPAHYAIPCQCGSKNCRGWIVDEEELPWLLKREARQKRKRA
jgi:hypothetical protein